MGLSPFCFSGAACRLAAGRACRAARAVDARARGVIPPFSSALWPFRVTGSIVAATVPAPRRRVVDDGLLSHKVSDALKKKVGRLLQMV